MKFGFFNTKVPLIQKGRRYPIQKDQEGKSLRQRCFSLFRQGRNAYEAAKILNMKLASARRYYSQWNECPPALDAIYKGMKRDLKEKKELSPKIIGMLKEALGMPEWQIIEILSRPNGLKSLLKGKYMEIKREELYYEQEVRLWAALQWIVDLERTGVPLE